MRLGVPITAPGVSTLRTARFSKTAIVGPSDYGRIVGPSDYGSIVGPSDRPRFGQLPWSDAADKAITIFTVGVIAVYVGGLAYMLYDGRGYRRR
jgi:hypothetical protein